MRNFIRGLVAASLLAALPIAANAGVFVSVNFAPPVLPVYVQPAMPAPGYMWTPGYWAWGGGGYFWVPGTWVMAPAPGLLWTPGYWGWAGGAYIWHGGYWVPTSAFTAASTTASATVVLVSTAATGRARGFIQTGQ